MRFGALVAFGAIATLSSINLDLSSHYVVHFSLLSGQVAQQGLISCTPPKPTSTPAPTDSDDQPSA